MVVSGAALPFPVAIHAAGAKGAGEEVSGARRHKITDSGRNVHPLVGHWRSVVIVQRTQIRPERSSEVTGLPGYLKEMFMFCSFLAGSQLLPETNEGLRVHI